MSSTSVDDNNDNIEARDLPETTAGLSAGPLVTTSSRAMPGIKSPRRLRLPFWGRKRTVAPVALRSIAGDELPAEHPEANASMDPLDDPDQGIIFLNNPTEFDLRAFIFGRPRSSPQGIEGPSTAASSYTSSMNSARSTTRELLNSTGSSRRVADTPGVATATTSAATPGDNTTTSALTFTKPAKPRRRLRAKEELCLLLPRIAGSRGGNSRSQKAWYLGAGFIGRDVAEGVLVATRDATMDSMHAQIFVQGDEYLIRDAQSSTGTFLCLSTRRRHYPQRDGFRLQTGDVFRVGMTTSIRVLELRTTTRSRSLPDDGDGARRNSKSLSTVDNIQVKRKPSTPTLMREFSSSSSSKRHVLKRMSGVEEVKLIAADIEEVSPRTANGEHYKAEQSYSSLATDSEVAPPRRVKFVGVPPAMSDGSAFMGSRYMRPEVKELLHCTEGEMAEEEEISTPRVVSTPAELNHEAAIAKPISPFDKLPSRRALLVRLAIFQHDNSSPPCSSDCPSPQDYREVVLRDQNTVLIGSSTACDARILAHEGSASVRAVHARIAFDGVSFVLQDLSFERDQKLQTRVTLSRRAVRLARGDWLLFGTCGLLVTTPSRAFGWDRRPDIKEAAMRCDILRLSKRQPRVRHAFIPVGFRLRCATGTGATSGSSGWGGSSGGPVVFGKGRDCDAQVFTATLAVEQFSVQLERGTCMLTPKATGINSGTYFLIGRKDPGPPPVTAMAVTSYVPAIALPPESELVAQPDGEVANQQASNSDSGDGSSEDIVRYASKALLLAEGCIFRCGGTELEVIYVKQAAVATSADIASVAAVEDQEHVQFLCVMPWLQHIARDYKTVANLARCGQRLRLDAGDVIYEEGDAASFIFIVLRGEVVLDVADGTGNGPNDEQEEQRCVLEHVSCGGCFGEVSLQEASTPFGVATGGDSINGCGHEYGESARATSACELLALASEDVCGYLALYLDVVRAYLCREQHRKQLLRMLRKGVAWLRDLPTAEMRTLISRAKSVKYQHGDVLLNDGKIFIHAASSDISESDTNNTHPRAVPGDDAAGLHPREGLLLLTRGRVHVTRQRSSPEKASEGSSEDMMAEEHEDEWWDGKEPIVVLPRGSVSEVVTSSREPVVRLEARSDVRCYFLDIAHVLPVLQHLNTAPGTAAKLERVGSRRTASTHAVETSTPPPLVRKNSVARRMHHSQCVTSALRSSDAQEDPADDERGPLDAPDGGSDGSAGRRWRRKKRNKHLLERTVMETQRDTQLPNALVLYVLAGAQRGDIHVVRNVASVGGLLSGADIELNDRYVSRNHAVIEYRDNRYWLYDEGSTWGTFVRLDEDHAAEIHPGDVFLAGEVEFTCLASYPERNRPSMCSLM